MAKKSTIPQGQNDILLWIPSKELFFKIQPGTGDALDEEDIKDGYKDYFIWNTFKADYLGLDSELELECEDAGFFMVKTAYEPTEKYIKDCLKEAFDEAPKYIILMTKPD